MADRYTSITAPSGTTYSALGKLTRAEAVKEFRSAYEQQLKEAREALAVPDDELVVTTYRGLHARRDLEVVREPPSRRRQKMEAKRAIDVKRQLQVIAAELSHTEGLGEEASMETLVALAQEAREEAKGVAAQLVFENLPITMPEMVDVVLVMLLETAQRRTYLGRVAVAKIIVERASRLMVAQESRQGG